MDLFKNRKYKNKKFKLKDYFHLHWAKVSGLTYKIGRHMTQEFIEVL